MTARRPAGLVRRNVQCRIRILYSLGLAFLLAALLAPATLFAQEPAPAVVGVQSPTPYAQISWFEDRRESTSELQTFLADQDAAVRARAAVAIGRIGLARDVALLAPLLHDPDLTVRRHAAFALGEIEDSTAAAALERHFTVGGDPDATTRALCVEGLGKLRRGPGAVRAALLDPDTSVVVSALHAAWQVPGTDPLVRVLEQSLAQNSSVQRAAACCLMRFLGVKPSGKTAVPEVSPVDPDLKARAAARLRELTASSDPQVRIYATRGLAGSVDEATSDSLLTRSTDPDWRIRVEATRALATPGRRVRTRVLWPLLKDRNRNVRVAATEALATLGPARDAIPRLQRLFHDPSSLIREAAFGALLTRYRAEGDPMPGPAIDAVEAASLDLLSQADWRLRSLAADGASLLPIDLSLPILDRMLRDEPRVARAAVDPLLQRHARLHALPILAQVGADLERLLSSRDPVLRAGTLESLGSIFADTTLTPDASDWMGLEMIFEQSRRYSAEYDRVPDVRLAIIEATRQHTARPEMRRILEECTLDHDYLVRRAASVAMQEAGLAAPRDAAPIETGMSPADYDPILKWAQADHWAVIETYEGTIVVRLDSREAPLTCWNFSQLATAGFFDKSRWHRVVPDFVLQAGCSRGDGFGGAERTIRCEINHRRYTEGTIGMALSGKDTGTSQFFLTHSDQPHLDGRYTAFGQVEKGMDVASRVTQGGILWSIRVVDTKP